MTSNLRILTRRAAPWRSGLPWRVLTLQGLVATALGLYLVVATERSAARATILLLGAWVLATAVVELAAALRHTDRPDQLVAARAGAALVGGLVVVLQSTLESVSDSAAGVVLGIALLVSAVGALLGAALGAAAPWRIRGMTALEGLLFGVVGWLLLGFGPGSTALRTLGGATAGLGLVMLGSCLALRHRTDEQIASPINPMD